MEIGSALLGPWCGARIMRMDDGVSVLAADSSDPWRPQVHFTPARNWMNDPNGLIWHEGEYHLFFQHNPHGTDWGHMSWGHAVSTDLVHWQELPVAILEDENAMIFSGSVVLDSSNTSGFGSSDQPPLVAVYTADPRGGGPQTQALAFSTDRGRTWTKHSDNPVLVASVHDFRDPKVFWDAARDRWLMVVALPSEHRVRFYASSNLSQWSHLSDFGPAGGVGGVWECPDLFALPLDGDPQRRAWVLLVSINPGGPAGGSATQWFVGDFDGTTFTPLDSDSPEQWLDHGSDCYAGVTFNDVPDGRRLLMGWMSNWDYARDVPTPLWKGAMTVPRELSLRTVDDRAWVCSSPAAELSGVRGAPLVHLVEAAVVGSMSLPCNGSALDIDLVFAPSASGASGLDVLVGDDEHTRIGYDSATGVLFIDRSRAHQGAPSRLKDVHAVAVPLVGGTLHLRVIVDSASVEVFAQHGTHVMTDLVFPVAGSDGIALFSEGSAHVRSLTIWPLDVGRPL